MLEQLSIDTKTAKEELIKEKNSLLKIEPKASPKAFARKGSPVNKSPVLNDTSSPQTIKPVNSSNGSKVNDNVAYIVDSRKVENKKSTFSFQNSDGSLVNQTPIDVSIQ